MARPFTSTQSRHLTTEHRTILSRLKNAEILPEKYRAEIMVAADALISQEVTKILKEIPVEELNRDKRGFRVRTLREHGFSTIADLTSASVPRLAAIQGISDDGAYAIKREVDELAAQAHAGVKVRLSTDNQTPAATQLISAIAKYKNCLPHAEICRKLLSENSQSVQRAIQDLIPGQSGLRWFFSSKAKKQQAQNAYQFLTGLLNSAYGNDANTALRELDAIQTASDTASWEEFSKDSIRFFNVLETIRPGLLGTDNAIYGLPDDLAQAIQEEPFFPEGLRCELRR